MQPRSQRSSKEHKQYVLIARWLDYLSYRFSPPGRFKRTKRIALVEGETDFPSGFYPLVKETLVEKWFWVGVVVVLNVAMAILNFAW